MVSVIIPVFNRFHLVEEMVNSILIQTYRDWELLLVDDSSTDGTYEKLLLFALKDSRIRVLQTPSDKKGAPASRNYGFSKAKGDLIIFFDSDDVITPFCLEQRVDYMNSHSNVDAGVFPARHFKKSILEPDGLLNGVPIFEDDLKEFLGANLPFIVWNVIFRRERLVEKNISWDEQLLSLQDADFNIQCIINGLRISYAKDAKIDYYARSENNNSISASIYNVSRFDSHLYFVDKMFRNLSMDDRKKYRNATYFRLVYTYMLMSYNYSIKHIEKLIGLSKEFNCKSVLFRLSILFNRFLTDKLQIDVRRSNMLTFPYFVMHMRSCSKKRNTYNRLKFNK